MSISEEEIQKKLSWLTEDERLILNKVYEGLEYKEISLNLNFTEPNIKKIMGQVYGKLGLADETRTIKKKKIFEVYGPGLERMLVNNLSAESDKTVVSPSDETSKIKESSSEKETPPEYINKIPDSKGEEGIPPEKLSKSNESKGEEEISADQFFEIPKPISGEDDSGDDETPSDFQNNKKPFDNRNEIKNNSIQQPRDRGSLRRFIFGIIVGMAVMALILFQFIPGETPINDNLIDEAQTIEQTVIHDAIVEAPSTEIVPAQEGPTPTEVLVPVLEAGYIFSDNFDLGPDPAWEVIYGDPGMANGKYTVIAPSIDVQTTHFSLLSNLFWENVSIEIEISGFSKTSGGNAIGAVVIHYNNETGGVGLILHPYWDGIQFATISKNGEWTMLDSTLVNDDINLDRGPNIIRIDVSGENYFAYLNNTLITSATIKGFDLGQIGLWMITSRDYGVPEYYAPRFEYITIESLP